MASIQSLPAEVCTQIFGNLDVNSALALASTCKGLGAVLKNNQQAIAKEIATDTILKETGYVCHATVKLAFMAVEAKRIREVRDIGTLLVFQHSFVGAAAKAKNWIKLAGGIPKLIQFIYKLVMPNLTCFPVEDKIMCLSLNEKGRMIRAILAAETVCNLVQCVQGNTDTPWGNSIRMSRKFWLQFSRHEGKQMDGIMAGLQASK
ncbi:hypothetical protein F4809DRAFT_588794 [Biscogniauxia mediterranea]|nr:hypothetical protein F4809DRAFT_588794 [Biscogniauxia mediterranea]